MDAPHLPPPKKETHAMCSPRIVLGMVARLCTSVHVCVSVCTVCARCVSVVHGVHSVQNVLSPDGGFQRVFCEVCAHLQNVSDSVAELDAPREQVDGSEICACRQEKQLRKGFQPGEQKRALAPDPGAFSVRGRPGADLAGFGQIWRPGGYSN